MNGKQMGRLEHRYWPVELRDSSRSEKEQKVRWGFNPTELNYF